MKPCPGPAVLFLTLAALLMAVPLLQLTAEGGEDVFMVVSITEMGGGLVDVKLRNERTHYVHSVTITIEININFTVGDRVRERRTSSGILLVRADAEETGGGDEPPPRGPLSEKPKLPPGYIALPIENLRVINSYRPPKPSRDALPADSPLSPTWLAPGICDALANGSFTASGIPAGPVARNGRFDTAGYGKSLTKEDEQRFGKITTDFRGGVAVSLDGALTVGRQQGRTWNDIRRAFPGVSSFMGGGAMILEGGREVPEDDLFLRQGFADLDPATHGVKVENGTPKTGFNADQLRSARHTVVGTHGGQTFLIISSPRSGRQVQKDLKTAGFFDAVMFDGGNGLYFTDGKQTLGKPSNNSLGLCVRTAR